MKKWFLKNALADFDSITKKFGISEVVARLIVNRGAKTEEEIDEYINCSIENLYNPLLMKDMAKARDIIANKISNKKPIRIVGDYDVDGVISTYILIEALSRCGAIVDYEIPDRIKDGYGINIAIIDKAYEDGIDTILTCDNGIAALKQTEHAKKLGMTMVITDHHDIAFEENDGIRTQNIPMADAVVNPHQEGCNYPYKNLCGAAVAFKFIEALFEKMGYSKNDAMKFLEYVSIATVCDVMELKGENRTIVKCGIKNLEKTKNYGLRALFKINNIHEISSFHLGFVIGPSLNATGRLATAKRAIELLRCTDEAEADVIAIELKELNDSRKKMTQDNLVLAINMIESTKLINDKVLVVYIKDCHESLAGIIAGRLRDKYGRPAVVITSGENIAKGSCRSIEKYNMFEELLKCQNYLEKFGGHPMAAGLSLKEENIDMFREALNNNTVLTDEDLIPKVSVDVVLPLGYISEELIKEIELIEPCGKDNEKPVFAEKNLFINRARVFGKNANVLKLSITNQYNKTMDAVFFGEIEKFDEYIVSKFGENELDKMYNGMVNDIRLSIIYVPTINEYNGRKTLQVQIKEYQ